MVKGILIMLLTIDMLDVPSVSAGSRSVQQMITLLDHVEPVSFRYDPSCGISAHSEVLWAPVSR